MTGSIHTTMVTLKKVQVNLFRTVLLFTLNNIVTAAIDDLSHGEKTNLRTKPVLGSASSEIVAMKKPFEGGSLFGQGLLIGLKQLSICLHEHHSIYCLALVSALMVGLTGIIPLLLLPVISISDNVRQGKSKYLNRLLSFGLGSMLGDVFLHLLPESWSSIKASGHTDSLVFHNGCCVLVGIISFFLLERCFPEAENSSAKAAAPRQAKPIITQAVQCDAKMNSNNNNSYHVIKNCDVTTAATMTSDHVDKDDECNIKPSGYLNLLANAIDNFTHGLAVGSSYLISRRVGMLTTLAILFHEIPHEVGDFALLLRAGFSKMRAAKMQVFTASGSVLGAIVALNGGNNAVWILPFTSGGFIYIALSTIVPDLMKETSFKESFIHLLCMVIAICTMHLLSFLDHH